MRGSKVFFLIVVVVSTCDAQWIRTNGPYGGNVHSYTVSGTNLFAGTNGGVFLSTNNGTGWTAANTGLTNRYVYALAVSGMDLFATREAATSSVDISHAWEMASTPNCEAISLAVFAAASSFISFTTTEAPS